MSEAGRVLDAEIHERVMQRPVVRLPFVPSAVDTRASAFTDEAAAEWYRNYPRSATVNHVPRYSADMIAAWSLVPRLNELGWLVTIKHMPEGVPFVIDPEGGKIHERAVVSLQWVQWMKDASAGTFKIGPTEIDDSAAVALCRAALRVVRQPPRDAGAG